MNNVLLVPIHLDALVLAQNLNVVEAFADFSKQPYNDGNRDINFNNANLSESILSHPFQDANLRLKAGLHLHWALPDGLTRQQGDGFRLVPNRWLVTRSIPGQATVQYVVESDYLYPDGQGSSASAVTVPWTPVAPDTRPFRYLGRTVPYASWSDTDITDNGYLPKLTAIGYGEPSFAAFYPNSQGVFGYYDPDVSTQIPAGLSYEAIGWFADPAQDALGTWLQDFTQNFSAKNGRTPTVTDTIDALQIAFGWTFDANDAGGGFPNRMLCYSRLHFPNGGTPCENPALGSNGSPPVTVGNTGTEALSAYLAETIDPAYKTTLEDQLEALQLGSVMGSHVLDVGAQFRQARHQKQFTASIGGSRWRILPAGSSEDSGTGQPTLPDALAEQFGLLNLRQQQYDTALAEIESLRRHLFADWYKYMVASYPPLFTRDQLADPDRVRYFIEQRGLVNLDKKMSATGSLSLSFAANGAVNAASSGTGGPADSLAAKLADAINGLLAAIAALPYQLRQSASARYWQPTNPVVLLTGDQVEPSCRYGQDGAGNDGLLVCQIEGFNDLQPLIPNHFSQIEQALTSIGQNAQAGQIGFSDWTEQPWHPILLQWEVQVFPTQALSNLVTDNREYDPDYINHSYQLATEDVDLSLKTGQGGVISSASVYSGTSVLSPYAKNQLIDSGLRFLMEQQAMLEAFYADNPGIAQNAEGIYQAIDLLQTWYAQTYLDNNPQTQAQDPVYTTIRALALLKTTHVLSQSLDGFNQALIMQHQTLQLALSDPLGFTDAQAFSNQVNAAVQGQNRSAPLPMNDFIPIRTGLLRLRALRLVDNFGRVKTVPCDSLYASEPLDLDSSPQSVELPPRLSQPARLNLRWLAANNDMQEMDDHPSAKPICGWVLANHLDHSLAVYDADGVALGSITPNTAVPWQPAPGSPWPISVNLIDNPHLRQMVAWILRQGRDFLSAFLQAIDNAFATMAPENPAQDQGMALLLGKPLALVRASVSLDVLGLPAIHQGWNRFRQDLQRNTRESDAFTQVRFPVRIGDYHQYNDSLVGYWLEEEGGYQDDTFFAPQTDDVDNPHIRTHSQTPMNITLAINDKPCLLSMLFDPRGLVHASSGIVPAKAIDIPPEQYQDALQNIQVSFLTAPILTDRNQVQVPLPLTPGGSWSWLQQYPGGWQETAAVATVRKQAFADTFGVSDANGLWLALQACAWINVTDPILNIASVTPRDQRSEPLPDAYSDRQDAIEAVLLHAAIATPSTQAEFGGPSRMAEGWLKLQRLNSTTGK